MTVAELVTRLDAATNAIAARLKGIVEHKTLSAEDAAALNECITKLEAMGTNPANPV